MPPLRLIAGTLVVAIGVGVGAFTCPAAAAAPEESPAGSRRPKADRPHADRPRPAAAPARIRAEVLALDLSGDQRRQVEELFAQAERDMATGRGQSGVAADSAKSREHAKEVVRTLRQRVTALLSQQQRQALRRRLEQRPPEGAGPPGAEQQFAQRVKDALKSVELSDEQKQKLDAVLADGQRKAREVNQQAQAKLRELMRETRAGVENLLTPEQRQKLRQSLPGPDRPRDKQDRRGDRSDDKRPTQPPSDRL